MSIEFIYLFLLHSSDPLKAERTADEVQLFGLGLLVTSFICCVDNLWLKWVCNPRTFLQVPAAKGSGTK